MSSAYPLNLVPDRGFLRDYVDLYTPLSEAPAEAHLATALAVASAALGWRAYLRWGESSEPCTLFILLQGASATAKKTTTARTGSGLVRYAEKMAAEENALAAGERAPLAVRSISHTSRRGLLELIATSDAETAKAWEQGYPPGMLLDWDEFGMILGVPGEVKGGDYIGQIRTTLMEIYGGRHGGIQIGALKMPASRCAVAILATMTRRELEERVSSGILRDGFMGRFVMMPNPGRQRYMAVPPGWSPEHSDIRDRLARFLHRVSTSKQEMGDVFRRLTPAAKAMRIDWYDRRMKVLDEDARAGGEMESALVDAMGRLQSTAMKVAAVAAVCEMAEDEGVGEVLIDTKHIEYGVALAEHALTEIKSLGGEGGVPTDRYRLKVRDYLMNRNGKGAIGRSEILDRCRMDGMSREDCWKVIQNLHREAMVEISIARTGGRPKQVVEWIHE